MSFAGVFGEIIGAVIGLYIANTLPNWHIPIVTSAYFTYLPYINMAIIGTCIAKIFMHLSTDYRFQRICEAAAHLVSIFSLYMLLVIRPFDFSAIGKPEFNDMFQFIFIIAILGVGIAFLVTIPHIIRGRESYS